MNKRKKIVLLLDTLLVCVLTIVDQLTKYHVNTHLKGKTPFIIIDKVLEFTYLENHGTAFGLLNNQKFFIIFVAIIFLGVIGYTMIKIQAVKKYDKLHIALSVLTAGALGNLIDRIRLGYVIDFIYLKWIRFPVFNIADILVTTSSIMIICLLLFVYKEQDLDFLNFKQKRYRELK